MNDKIQNLEDVFLKIYYPDGSFYAQSKVGINFPSTISFKINDYNDLWFLNQCKDIYSYNNKNFSLYIPCLLDQQADKRFEITESFNLKLICNFLNSLKLNHIYLNHPHSDVSSALLNNCTVLNNSDFIKKVISNSNLNKYNTVLMSSDAGGFKSLMKLVDNINWEGETYSASKSRKYENNKSTLIQIIDKIDFEEKNILIVDDLCLYGGTFIGLAKLLKEKNCGNLFLAISHLTVKNPNKELETYFKNVYTTNSKYDRNEYNLNNLILIENE